MPAHRYVDQQNRIPEMESSLHSRVGGVVSAVTVYFQDVLLEGHGCFHLCLFYGNLFIYGWVYLLVFSQAAGNPGRGDQ